MKARQLPAHWVIEEGKHGRTARHTRLGHVVHLDYGPDDYMHLTDGADGDSLGAPRAVLLALLELPDAA